VKKLFEKIFLKKYLKRQEYENGVIAPMNVSFYFELFLAQNKKDTERGVNSP
jgi:hypothetical protein